MPAESKLCCMKRDAEHEPQALGLSFAGQLPVPATLNARILTLQKIKFYKFRIYYST